MHNGLFHQAHPGHLQQDRGYGDGTTTVHQAAAVENAIRNSPHHMSDSPK
jgi:hypothetical protein